MENRSESDFCQWLNSTNLFIQYENTNDRLAGIAFLAAIVLMIILSVFNLRNGISSRQFFLIPVNFFQTQNRLPVCIILSLVFMKMSPLSLANTSTLLGIKFPRWATFIFSILNAVVMGITYYPLLCCVNNKSLVGSTVGLTYTLFLLLTEVVFLLGFLRGFICIKTNLSIDLLIAALELPSVICLFALLGLFVKIGFKTVVNQKCTLKWSQKPENILTSPLQRFRVKCLLSPKLEGSDLDMPPEHSHSHRFMDKAFQNLDEIKRIYKKSRNFRYPATVSLIVTTYAVCFYQFCVVVIWGLSALTQYIQTLSEPSLKTLATSSIDVGWVVFGLTLVFYVFQACKFLSSLRKNLLKLYCGDLSVLPKKIKKLNAKDLMVYHLSFPGTQIALVYLEFLWTYILFLAVCISINVFVVLPIKGTLPISLFIFILNIPIAMILRFLLGYILKFCSRYILAIENDRNVLAVKNNILYHNISYFMLFIQIFIGLLSGFRRVLLSACISFLYLTRTDVNVLPQEWMSWDSAHFGYLSYIQMELTHSHPVLLMFCELLLEFKKDKSMERTERCMQPTDIMNNTCSRAKKRWMKTYTMLRNPSLIPNRNCDES